MKLHISLPASPLLTKEADGRLCRPAPTQPKDIANWTIRRSTVPLTILPQASVQESTNCSSISWVVSSSLAENTSTSVHDPVTFRCVRLSQDHTTFVNTSQQPPRSEWHNPDASFPLEDWWKLVKSRSPPALLLLQASYVTHFLQYPIDSYTQAWSFSFIVKVLWNIRFISLYQNVFLAAIISVFLTAKVPVRDACISFFLGTACNFTG